MVESNAKKVLIIAMLDSIHTYRWLSQFQNDNIEFFIFPSKKFRNIHKDLVSLLRDNSKQYHLESSGQNYKFAGYFDFFLTKISKILWVKQSRLNRLDRLIHQISPDIIHAIEIQGAGYLLSELNALKLKKLNVDKIILTNYGSDIFFFEKFENHGVKISDALAACNFYSAECERDYDLAKKFGFTGKFLPCIPNAGGFEFPSQDELIEFDSRNLLLIKGYGGLIGRANLALQVLPNILEDFTDIEVHFYSVTTDLLLELERLQNQYPQRVSFSTVRKTLTYQEMRKLFLRAKIYIGASISDGISTSFLESLIFGAFPIQTNTSCIDEWEKRGYKFKSINPSSGDIECGIREVLESNFDLSFQSKNYELAKLELTKEKVKEKARTFYEN